MNYSTYAISIAAWVLVVISAVVCWKLWQLNSAIEATRDQIVSNIQDTENVVVGMNNAVSDIDGTVFAIQQRVAQ